MPVTLTAPESQFRFHFAFSRYRTVVCLPHGPVLRIVTTQKPVPGFENWPVVEQPKEYDIWPPACRLLFVPCA